MSAPYGLTPLQQGIYAGSALTQRPWQYVEQIVVHLPDEALDPDLLGQAWTDLTVAHPALRNVIDPETHQQHAAAVTPITPLVQDWRGQDAGQALNQFLTKDRDTGVDATTAPGFRLTLFRTGDASSILVWTFSHSLLDGRAFAPLLDEAFARYAALQTGKALPAPTPETLFEDHCRALDQMDHAAGVAHFTRALAGWEGTEGLVDRDAAPARKNEVETTLTGTQTQTLTTLAQAMDVSVGALVQTAWGIVLARFSGQSKVVFGSTRNGRHVIDGARDAAGCFITTVPMQLTLDPALTLAEAVQNIAQANRNVRPFEHTPLTQITRALDLPPGKQLFDTIVMFDVGTLDEKLKALGTGWQTRHTDLFEEGDTPVSVAAYLGARLHLVIEYDPAKVAQGPQLADHFTQFLAGLETALPTSPIGSLSMLSPDQQSQMTALAGPEHAADLPTCIAQFEQRAAATPNHIAMMQPDQPDLGYGALNERADTLAANLAQAGVTQGDTIGICMARGYDFITAMLAVWKRGAAFVPMDPTYPAPTLEIIAQDSRARLVLTDDNAPTLSAPTRAIATLQAHDLPPAPHVASGPDDLAYIIFTSGSTGRPKGVMIPHRAFAAHAAAIIPLFELTPQDRVLQFAALSFDVALEEVIPTLLAGATLVLRNDAMSQSLTTFLEQIDALKITTANLPTGFWVALTEALETQNLPFPDRIRLMIVGGERVPLSVLKRWRARLPQVRWLNGYGPTETTITCTTFDATHADLEGDTVPIGKPLSHARAWVLSADGAVLPEGVEGELFISGPAVAQGYIGNPERTAQSFGTAIFDPDAGRIYATGDRVMWHDSQLQYLGRMDRQIKLRGFRIEPGQIEAALEQLDDIDRAHADIHVGTSGTPQLVAWYSAPAGADLPDAQSVKASLKGVLPAQIQPLPVAVPEWPQTPGGKVDTKRLPAPEQAVADSVDSLPSDDPMVPQIAELFADVLNIPLVGEGTSFFDAGGDSLSLLRLMPMLEDAFDVRLEPTALYSDPTPRGVAIALQNRETDPLVVMPIQPQGTLPPLYAVHVLGDNGSYFRPLAAELGQDQPVFGLTVGLLNAQTPTSVEGLAEFYLHQIERHHPDGPVSLIAVSAGSYVTLELAQLLQAAGREVLALIFLDAEGPGGRPRVGKLARVTAHLGKLRQHGFSYLRDQLAKRTEKRAQDAAQLRMQAVQDDDAPIEASEIGGVEDFVAANLLAIEAYVPQPYARPLTIYRAGDDPFDAPAAIATGLGWSDVAQGGFDIEDVPGDHLGLLDPPNVTTLAAKVKALLAGRRSS